jgi:predicted ribosome quality control (RQC) complex YloA/Tae2 family protein
MAKRKTKRPSVYDDLRTSASGLSKAVSAVLRRQDEMEKDLDKLEAKLDKQETKYDKLERKSDKLEAKLDALEVKADKVESKYDRLETKFDKVERKEDRKRQAAIKAGETVVSQPLRIQLPDLPSVQAFRQSSRAIAAALRARRRPGGRAGSTPCSPEVSSTKSKPSWIRTKRTSTRTSASSTVWRNWRIPPKRRSMRMKSDWTRWRASSTSWKPRWMPSATASGLGRARLHAAAPQRVRPRRSDRHRASRVEHAGGWAPAN